MHNATIRLRPMTMADLAVAQRLSAAVGWPHREEDWRFVLELGHGVVACVGDGAPVGTAMWWTFDQRLARIGMIIVDPTRQKSGLGRRLMDAVFEASGCAALVLNATAAGAPLYRQLGFAQVASIMQYQGVVELPAPIDLAADERIRPANSGDLAAITTLDAVAHGIGRAPVLRHVASHGPGLVLERAGKIDGFAFAREFGRGWLVAPVVARDRERAKALIRASLVGHEGTFVRIDVPDAAELGEWLQQLGMRPIAPAFTMIRGPVPVPAGAHAVFALVNQALG